LSARKEEKPRFLNIRKVENLSGKGNRLRYYSSSLITQKKGDNGLRWEDLQDWEGRTPSCNSFIQSVRRGEVDLSFRRSITPRKEKEKQREVLREERID